MPENDDHEEEPMQPHIHPLGFLHMPPPTPEQIAEEQMRQTAVKHDMYRVFAELDEDQLIAIRSLFNICSNPHCGPAYAEHFEGISVGILHAKFGVCMTCGVNHDKEASDLGTE